MGLMSPRSGGVALISMISAILIYSSIYFRLDLVVTHQATKRISRLSVYDDVVIQSGKPKPRVMCMIFTTLGNFERKARAAEKTWSRHCYRRRFFYSRQGDTNHSITKHAEAVALDVPEGRGHLTAKTMAALLYSYRHFANDTDWFMKADDDVYVFFNNLLLHLCRYDPFTPVYMGCKFATGYNSGGAGYLLSKNATNQVANEGITKFAHACKLNSVGGYEDMDMGHCLRALNIFPAETKDSSKQLRFHPENPYRFLRGALLESDDHGLEPYHNAMYNGVDFNDYNSTTKDRMLGRPPITFHYVSPAEMYFIDYLISVNETTTTSDSTFCKK